MSVYLIIRVNAVSAVRAVLQIWKRGLTITEKLLYGASRNEFLGLSIDERLNSY